MFGVACTFALLLQLQKWMLEINGSNMDTSTKKCKVVHEEQGCISAIIDIVLNL